MILRDPSRQASYTQDIQGGMSLRYYTSWMIWEIGSDFGIAAMMTRLLLGRKSGVALCVPVHSIPLYSNLLLQ